MSNTFFELIQDSSEAAHSGITSQWRDESTEQKYVFTTTSGYLALRRRRVYPCTYAYIQGSILHFGYGDESTNGIIAPEFLRGTFDARTGRVTIRRDTHATLALFYGQAGGRTAVSNDFAFVCSAISERAPLRVSTRALINFLLACDHGDRMTLFEETGILGERQQLDASKNRLRVTYPQSWEPSGPMLNSAGNPYDFKHTLEQVLNSYWQLYGGKHAAFELSAGVDSATMPGVLVASGQIKHPLLGTVMYPLDFQASQTKKIKDFQQRFGSRHISVPLTIRQHTPLTHLLASDENRALCQYDECYLEAFDTLAERLAEHAVQTVFGGTGGDELFGHHNLYFEAEPFSKQVCDRMKEGLPAYLTDDFVDVCWRYGARRDEPIPLSPKPKTCLDAPLAENLAYANRGIWQVNPLADVSLFQYCQSLPYLYKKRKGLLRAFQASWRFPASMYAPEVNENFEPFLCRAFEQRLLPFLQRLLPSSPLVHAGIIDGNELERQLLRAKGQEPYAKGELYFRAYIILSMDSTLRSVHKGVAFK